MHRRALAPPVARSDLPASLFLELNKRAQMTETRNLCLRLPILPAILLRLVTPLPAKARRLDCLTLRQIVGTISRLPRLTPLKLRTCLIFRIFRFMILVPFNLTLLMFHPATQKISGCEKQFI
jgi:hypothetical protein